MTNVNDRVRNTMKPDIKYGACEDPAKYPERFIFHERREDYGPSYYWEVELK